MDKVLEVSNEIKTRMDSPFWGKFVIAFIAWNWKTIYILFFLDQDLIFRLYLLTRVEYALASYDFLHSIIYGLILPFFSVLFLTFVFPKFENWIYKEFESNKSKKSKIKIFQENKDSRDMLEYFKLKRQVKTAEEIETKNSKELAELIENLEKEDIQYQNLIIKNYEKVKKNAQELKSKGEVGEFYDGEFKITIKNKSKPKIEINAAKNTPSSITRASTETLLRLMKNNKNK